MLFFVPAWGWVGSTAMPKANLSQCDFRPRLGMGWFADYVYIMCYLNLFSSPSGDGLVLDFGETIEEIFVFSSPLGVGLVHEKNNNDNK